MQFVIPGKPIAKARHKSRRTPFGIATYDPQKASKDNVGKYIKLKMREKGLQSLQDRPLHLDLRIGTQKPKRLAKAPQNALYAITKPDLDNYLKFYSDAMNNIAYHDDNLIASISASKFYTDDPFVQITLSTIEDTMINEHAKTLQDHPTIDDLEYMIKKANKLGKAGRDILRVFVQNDSEGKHIYFETEPLQKINYHLENKEVL